MALLVVLGWMCAAIPTSHADDTLELWVAKGERSHTVRQAHYLTSHIRQRLQDLPELSIQSDLQTMPEQRVLRHVRAGKIPLAILGNSVIDVVPHLSLFRIPWLFESQDHVQEALYAGLEDAIRTEVEKRLGVVVVGVYANAFHNLRANETLFDPVQFKRRGMLITEGPSLQTMMQGLGVIALSNDRGNLKTQLRIGNIDSIDGLLEDLFALPIDTDDANVISLTQHVYEPTFFVASKAFWNGLTDLQRAQFTEMGADFSDTALRLAITHRDALFKNAPQGLRLEKVSPEPFANITALYRKNYIQTYGDDWLEFVDIGLENSY